MNTWKTIITGCGFVLALLVAPQVALAESAEELVAGGNEAYEKGKFDEALKAYEKAAKEKPVALIFGSYT